MKSIHKYVFNPTRPPTNPCSNGCYISKLGRRKFAAIRLIKIEPMNDGSDCVTVLAGM